MNLTKELKNILGIVTVQIEGFFTERFINLCKINNIKIWDIRTVVKGVVRFKINISDFKKLKKISKKTKCKICIKEKKGIYFTLFRYRKRKFAVILFVLCLMFCISFSTFIWNINISGNTNISSDEIEEKLKDAGLYVGKNKIGFDKKKVINNLRLGYNDISWIGIEIDGTTANVKVVEKTKLDDKDVQYINPGDIIATKSGIITKIVPENGTAMYKEGSYIEEGTIGIEGMIYSKFLDPEAVAAKGILKIKSEYIFYKEYKYNELIKEYTNKVLYTIGLTVNSNEKMINYLNKSKKYDISKSSKSFNAFNNVISLDLYKCVEYVQKDYSNSYEELINKAYNELSDYLNSVKSGCREPKILEESENIDKTEDGIIFTHKYIIEEEVGKYIERNY